MTPLSIELIWQTKAVLNGWEQQRAEVKANLNPVRVTETLG